MNLPRRPCLALPFTVLKAPGQVRLVAGEDFRYTLTAPGLDDWLPAWLALLDGARTTDELLTLLLGEKQRTARALLEQLAGERVLLDGPPVSAHVPVRYRPAVTGRGALRDLLACPVDEALPAVPVLAQDTLDLEEALAFNRSCLAGGTPWLWLTCGPLTRGYVGPAFLPDAGPCLACLLAHFRHLSPFPELYDELQEHARRGGTFAAASFPLSGLRMLVELVNWKLELLAAPDPPAALFSLHVLERSSLEVSAHTVFIDPECPACHGRR